MVTLANLREPSSGIDVPTASSGSRGPYWYRAFGLRISSDIRLPIPALQPAAGELANLTFRYATTTDPVRFPKGTLLGEVRCNCERHRGRTTTQAYRGHDGTWVWNEGIGICHLAPDARTVEVYPDAAVDERLLGLVLAGQISIFALHHLGYPCLHTSAVITDRGAIAFLGPKGQGKSTMAASLLRRGARLLTDDILPLLARSDGVYGVPSLPLMKLWQSSVEGTLELDEELPNLTTGLDKKLLTLDGRYGFARTLERVRAVYVLERYDPGFADKPGIAFRALSRRDSLTTLLAQTSMRQFLLPPDVARLLPAFARLVAQAPVRVLRYPHGFGYRDAVCSRILADLEER